jgi:hypothetical protein
MTLRQRGVALAELLRERVAFQKAGKTQTKRLTIKAAETAAAKAAICQGCSPLGVLGCPTVAGRACSTGS